MSRCRSSTRKAKGAHPVRPVLAILCFILCAACTRVATTGHATANSTTQHGIVRFGLGEDINTLNPLTTTLALEQEIDEAVFDGLVELDDQQHVIADLATEVPSLHNGGVSRDGRTLTYHLRHGVRWQDGAPFTADDVLFTFRTITDPRVNDSNTAIYRQVQSLAAPDKYTIVVHLKAPSAAALGQLFCNGEQGEIVPRHLLEHSKDFNRDPFGVAPVGTGPMRLERWERSSRLLLAPNPNYFRGAPRIRQLQLIVVPDANTRLTMITTKELDVAAIPLATQLARLRSIPGYSVDLVKGYTDVHATFNVTRAPFDDVRVRQALTMALDRKALIAHTYGEAGIPADSILPSYSWAYAADNHSLPYDVQRARRLLQQAGWLIQPDGTRAKNGHRLQFTLLTYAGLPQRMILAQLMQDAWKAVGAEVTLRPMAINMLFARDSILNKAQYDVALEGFTYDVDPDRTSNFSRTDFSPVGFNDSRFTDPHVEALLSRGLAQYERSARKAVYLRLQQRLNELVPSIPLGWPKTVYVFNNDLHGFKPEPVNSDFWNIQEWSI